MNRPRPRRSEQQRAERLVPHGSLCCTEENTPHNAESKDSMLSKGERRSQQEGQQRQRLLQHGALHMQNGLADPQESAENENVQAFEGWHSGELKRLPLRARNYDLEQKKSAQG